MAEDGPVTGLPQATIDVGGRILQVQLGSQQAFDEFYKGIGYAVNAWVHIDRKLFECLHAALGSNEQKAAIIYYRLKSQSERIGLANDLLKVTDLGALTSEWQKLYAEIKRLQPLRNLLAHQPLLGSSIIKNVSHIDPENPVQIEHFLSVDVEEKELLRGDRKPRKVEINELVQYCQHIAALHQRIIKFEAELRAFVQHSPPKG
jgi:hypothetical protein